MDIATIAGIVSAAAAIVVIPPAYLALRKKSDSPAAEQALTPGRPEGGRYDASICYAPQDAARATELARQLAARGREIFLAELIGYGLIELLEKQKAVLGSANGILIFSATTMASHTVQSDYAILLNQVNENGGRFVPVLIEHVRLPPFAAIRKPVDLTDPGSPDYEARIDRLAEAIRPGPVTGGPVS
jgi:hypothetical protein